MERITKDMTVEEIVERYPKAVEVFMRFNIPCLVCGEPIWGTLEETARKYNVRIDELLEELNKIV